MNAIYPGTFDPLTLGHEEIINRAAKLFDNLLVAVAVSSSKLTMFDLQDRLKLVRLITSRHSNVKVMPFEGLTVNFANANNIDLIIRGARNSSDFNYESQIAQMNSTLDQTVDSIFFIASDPFKSITSSLVREVINLNGDYSKFVSTDVANYLQELRS
jgi:pantetheine-phosphate adenylyltransferase